MTHEELTALSAQFVAYLEDICSQGPAVASAEWREKVSVILERLADSVIRKASSSLLPIDANLREFTDEKLANAMQLHVVARGGTQMSNSAWAMMLESARRLRSKRESGA